MWILHEDTNYLLKLKYCLRNRTTLRFDFFFTRWWSVRKPLLFRWMGRLVTNHQKCYFPLHFRLSFGFELFVWIIQNQKHIWKSWNFKILCIKKQSFTHKQAEMFPTHCIIFFVFIFVFLEWIFCRLSGPLYSFWRQKESTWRVLRTGLFLGIVYPTCHSNGRSAIAW